MRHFPALIRFILIFIRRSTLVVLVAAWTLAGPSLAAAAQFGTGSVSLEDTIDSGNRPWVTVDISSIDFGGNTPIIVAGPVTHENEQSLSVRVRNVTATGFEIALTSPCDSSNVDPNAGGLDCPPRRGAGASSRTDWQTETVRWMAIPEGVWQFPDGTKIEAGRENVSAVRSSAGDSNAGNPVSFADSYSSRPVVLHTVNTANDNAWITSSVFGPGNSVGSPPDATGFTLALEGAEVTTTHGAETIGWVAIEPGSGTNNGNRYHAGVSVGLDTPRHDDGCAPRGAFTGFGGIPDVVAGHNTMAGTNGGWLRFCSDGITTGGINLHIDEDQVGDGERSGLDEASSWFAFEASSIGFLVPGGAVTPFFARDSFEAYAAGSSVDGGNDGVFWGGAWSGIGGVEAVIDASGSPLTFSDTGDTITGDGLALRFAGNNDNAATRDLDESISSRFVYAAMLVRFEGLQNNNDFLSLWFEDSNPDNAPNFGIKMNRGDGSGPDDFFARSRQNNAVFDTNITNGQTYFLVARIEKSASSTYDKVSLWVDPTALGHESPPPVTGETSVESSGLVAFQTIGFRSVKFDSGDSVTIDELRLGTSWAEVTAPNEVPLQRGRVSTDTQSSGAFTSVSLTDFDQAPIVLATDTTDASGPAGARVRNVSAAGFEVAPVEPSAQDGPHGPIDIDYVAIGEVQAGERKLYLLDNLDGFAEFRRHATQSYQTNRLGSSSWDTLDYLTDFPSAPAVLGQVQTDANESANPPTTSSVPWLQTTVSDVDTDGFDVALERAESTAGSVTADETIGLVIIANGSRGNIAGLDYEALVSADSIQGFNNGCYTTSFSSGFGDLPVVVANRNTRDGTDGGWIRRCSLSAGSVALTVDEDQDNDGERSHTTERAAILAVTGVPATSVDYYAVLDPGQGLTCEALPVTIEARDASDNPVQPPSGTTINVFATDPGTSDPASDSSWASSVTDLTSHTFDGSSASVTLSLRRTSEGQVNVDVDDGAATESASADPDIAFVESGFLFYADGAASSIGGQIAAKPSNVSPGAQSLELRAVRDPDGPLSDAACEARLNDDQTIEMAFECRDPLTCSGTRDVAIDGTAIAANDAGGVSSYATVTLDFGSDGRAPFTLLYPDAGEIRLHARADVPASGDEPEITLTGESNAFVVRPFGFHLEAVGNPGATTAGGGVLGDAGAAFTVNATAVGWASGDDADDDGVPDGYGNDDPTDNVSLDPTGDNVSLPNFGPETDDETLALQAVLWQPEPGSDPGLAGATTIGEAAFEDTGDVGAGAGSTSVNYPEVGIIELRAQLGDGTYQGGANVVGRSGPVRRFTPADFEVTVRDQGMYEVTCNGTFSYVGEAFGYDIQPRLNITARNALGATTENYRGSFIKLSDVDIGVTPPSIDASAIGNISGTTDVAVTAVLNTGVLADDGDGSALGDGVLVYTFDGADSYVYDKVLNARIDADEFNADLPITVNDVTDSDGVTNGALPSPNPFAPTGAEIRFGQLSLENTYGPETEDLTVSLQVEYFDGDGYIVNAADGCTPLSITGEANHARVQLDDNGTWVRADQTVDLTGGTGGTTEGTGITGLTGGAGALILGSPGALNTGSALVRADLADFPWLRGDWDGDGIYDNFPTAIATFGVYRGHDRVIYWRER